MAYETIDFKADGAIARITLNRPDRLNSFTAQMHEEVRDALASLGDARVVVLTGAGRGFCAGQDLNDRAVAPGEAVDLGETVQACWNPLIRTLTSLSQPVIARMNGVAAGAGANVAIACDIVVAAKSAKFIQSFSAIGLIPDSGGTWHLPRLVGQARALGLALTGEALSAEKAAEWGLIWKAVDDDALDGEVDAIAEKLAALPPLGLAAIKESGRRSMVDEASLSQWFRTEILPLERALMAFLRRHWRNHEDLIDFRQDIYERVLAAAMENGLPQSAKAYLFVTARNHLVNQARRSRVVSFELVADMEGVEREFDMFMTDRHLAARDELRRVAAAMELLPSRVRDVVHLRRVEGLSAKETAEELNINLSTVEKEFTKGVRAITAYLLGGPQSARRHFSVTRLRKEKNP
jgi:2-(1,2-epoxy-1,2-dihydrophenyl)acetyl-CoA isomerase